MFRLLLLSGLSLRRSELEILEKLTVPIQPQTHATCFGPNARCAFAQSQSAGGLAQFRVITLQPVLLLYCPTGILKLGTWPNPRINSRIAVEEGRTGVGKLGGEFTAGHGFSSSSPKHI